MRGRGVLLAVGAFLGAVTVSGVDAPSAHAAGSCVTGRTSSGAVVTWRCDFTFATARPRGSIAILGDSVLQASAPTRSSPSLPDILATRGWGPVRMTTALGMLVTSTRSTYVSGVDWVDRWKADGVDPVVVAVNVGADHFGQCTGTDPVAACRAIIDVLLDHIAAVYPKAKVWWAKVVQRASRGGAYTADMTTWNAALDQEAAARPGSLVAWDWPAALAASSIRMDEFSIHVAGPADAVKRSTLIADHLTSFMPARYVGPPVPLPASGPSALEFVPQRNTSRGSLPSVSLAANAVRSIDVAPALPAATATKGAVLTATAAGSSAAGSLRVYDCERPESSTSVVHFGKGQRRSTQAVVMLTGTKVCAVATTGVSLQLGVQGGLALGGGTTFVPLTATPVTVRAAATPGRFTIAPTALAGSGVKAAAVTVTVDGPSGGGSLTLHQCGVAPLATSTIAFGANVAASGTAFVPVTNGAICMTTSFLGTAPRVRIGITGRFSASSAGARFHFAGAPKRVLDLRSGARLGGWYGRHVAHQTIGVSAAPTNAVAVTGAVTAYGPLVAGEVVAQPRGVPGGLPAVAFSVGSTPSSAAVTLSTVTSKVVNLGMRTGNAVTAFDVVGWWIP